MQLAAWLHSVGEARDPHEAGACVGLKLAGKLAGYCPYVIGPDVHNRFLKTNILDLASNSHPLLF